VTRSSEGPLDSRSRGSASRGVATSFTANISGTAWAALVQLAFTPMYLHFLGADAFGLIAFALTLQAFVQVLDLGMSPTASREVARQTATRDKRLRSFVFTFEIAYWVLTVAVAALFVAASGFLGRTWLEAATLSDHTMRQSALRIAVLVALQFPVTFYQSVLRGVDRHVVLNILRIVAVTSANGIALIAATRHGMTAFFTAQIAVQILHALSLRVSAWRHVPSGNGRRFDPTHFVRVWRFSAAMTTITVLAVVISQIDKLFISAIVPLASFGYYVMAWTIAGALFIAVVPAFNTLMPRFAALSARGDTSGVKEVYGRAIELSAVLLTPAAAVIALFAHEIVLIWIGDPVAAREAAPVASLLVIGVALNGVMNVPYALQLGEGWMRLALALTVGQAALYVPLLWILVRHHGTVGAAAAWISVNGAYFCIGLFLTQRRLSAGRGLLRLGRAVALPAGAAILCAGIGRVALRGTHSITMTVAAIGAVFLLATAAAVMASPTSRAMIRQGWR
jgi:O-antigen/teichoic acid export membrane protein